MQRSANGLLILVLGILSLVGFGCLTGLPAWIMGNSSLAAIDRGEADANERGMVQVGRVLGMVCCILSILGVVVFFLFVAGIFSLAAVGASQSR